MTDRTTAETTAIVLLIVFVLIPFAMIVLAYPAVPYHPVPGEPVREAAVSSGIRVTNVTPVTWPLKGSLGGNKYTLTDETGSTLVIQTQRFDSALSRDGAVAVFSAQSVGKGKTVGTLFVVGDHVIHVSPDTAGILTRIGPELRKRGRTG
jgi:hypothetical protein